MSALAVSAAQASQANAAFLTSASAKPENLSSAQVSQFRQLVPLNMMPPGHGHPQASGAHGWLAL